MLALWNPRGIGSNNKDAVGNDRSIRDIDGGRLFVEYQSLYKKRSCWIPVNRKTVLKTLGDVGISEICAFISAKAAYTPLVAIQNHCDHVFITKYVQSHHLGGPANAWD